LEKQYKVPKTYAVIGVIGLLFLLVITGFFDALICNLIGFGYPAYASFKALQTTDPEDDKFWLTYWIAFGFLSVIEFWTDVLLYWIPFYFSLKLALIFWLFLPQTKGAIMVYSYILKPALTRYSPVIDQKLQQAEKPFSAAAAELQKEVTAAAVNAMTNQPVKKDM